MPGSREHSCGARQQWNESYRIECLLSISARCAFDDRELLRSRIIRLCKRQYHAAARLQIPKQSGGHVGGTRRDDDCIDGELFAEIGTAVAVLQSHVLD